MGALNLFILLSVFLFAASLVGFVFLLWTESHFSHKRQIKKRLLYISAGGMHGREKLALYRSKVLNDAGLLEKFAFELPRIAHLDRMLICSRLPLNATTFVLLSLALAGFGVVIAFVMDGPMTVTVGLPLLLGALPYLLLRWSEKTTLRKFIDQCPEALDLMARAIRSGHALSSAMSMVADEMGDPIRSEFTTLVDEIKMGLTINEALENLCHRVPLQELRFFSISVQIQKETGGNVAEIFDNLSHLIRERASFRRQVRALTAEGRLSAGILLALPLLLFAYLYFVNYDYISLLWQEEAGLYMILVAAVAQLMGILVIRKIIRIEI